MRHPGNRPTKTSATVWWRGSIAIQRHGIPIPSAVAVRRGEERRGRWKRETGQRSNVSGATRHPQTTTAKYASCLVDSLYLFTARLYDVIITSYCVYVQFTAAQRSVASVILLSVVFLWLCLLVSAPSLGVIIVAVIEGLWHIQSIIFWSAISLFWQVINLIDRQLNFDR